MHATVGIADLVYRMEAWSAFATDDDSYRDCDGDDNERSLVIHCRQRRGAKRRETKRCHEKRILDESSERSAWTLTAQ